MEASLPWLSLVRIRVRLARQVLLEDDKVQPHAKIEDETEDFDVDEVKAAHHSQKVCREKTRGFEDYPDLQVQPSEASLPEKSGWVKKMCDGWLDPWEWRWLTLKDRRICWFDGPELEEFRGVVDFELVEAEVEVTWDPLDSKADEAAPQRSWCDAGGLVCLPRRDEVGFRICIAGSTRAFEMCVPSLREGESWVSALAEHLQDADARCIDAGRFRADQLDVFASGRFQWWKVSRISPETFSRLADTGDVLLFRSKGAMPRVIRTATGGHFDHVAMILKLDGGKLALLEATGNVGVSLVIWKEFLEHEWQLLYPELALRRVRFPRTAENLQNLQRWVRSVVGKPYALKFQSLRQRDSVGGNQQEFFCSQLVAEGLKVLGALPRGEFASESFVPSSFSCQSSPILCSPGCSFDPEDLTIDFSLASENISKNRKTAARDATVKLR